MKVSDYDPHHSMVALFKYKMSMSIESKKKASTHAFSCSCKMNIGELF